MNHFTWEIRPTCPGLKDAPIAHGAAVVPGVLVRMSSKAAVLLEYVPNGVPFKSSLDSAILNSWFEYVVETSGKTQLAIE
jgi:hypothetical protein